MASPQFPRRQKYGTMRYGAMSSTSAGTDAHSSICSPPHDAEQSKSCPVVLPQPSVRHQAAATQNQSLQTGSAKDSAASHMNEVDCSTRLGQVPLEGWLQVGLFLGHMEGFFMRQELHCPPVNIQLHMLSCRYTIFARQPCTMHHRSSQRAADNPRQQGSVVSSQGSKEGSGRFREPRLPWNWPEPCRHCSN